MCKLVFTRLGCFEAASSLTIKADEQDAPKYWLTNYKPRPCNIPEE